MHFLLSFPSCYIRLTPLTPANRNMMKIQPLVPSYSPLVYDSRSVSRNPTHALQSTNQGSYAATPIQSSLRLGFHGLLSILWSFPSGPIASLVSSVALGLSEKGMKEGGGEGSRGLMLDSLALPIISASLHYVPRAKMIPTL